MKYVVLVSHGTLAQGMHSVLSMLVGEGREDIVSASLQNGMGADEYAEQVKAAITNITPEDEIILLGDLVGGSPLTTASNVIAENGLIANTTILGGMNLPMALTAALMKDGMDREDLVPVLINEAQDAIKEFKIALETDDDDI